MLPRLWRSSPMPYQYPVLRQVHCYRGSESNALLYECSKDNHPSSPVEYQSTGPVLRPPLARLIPCLNLKQGLVSGVPAFILLNCSCRCTYSVGCVWIGPVPGPVPVPVLPSEEEKYPFALGLEQLHPSHRRVVALDRPVDGSLRLTVCSDSRSLTVSGVVCVRSGEAFRTRTPPHLSSHLPRFSSSDSSPLLPFFFFVSPSFLLSFFFSPYLVTHLTLSCPSYIISSPSSNLPK